MRYLVEFSGPRKGDEARVIVVADSADEAIPKARRRAVELAAKPGMMFGRPIDPAEFATQWRIDVVHPA